MQPDMWAWHCASGVRLLSCVTPFFSVDHGLQRLQSPSFASLEHDRRTRPRDLSSDPFAPLMFVNGADTELRRTVGGSCGFCAARPGRSPRPHRRVRAVFTCDPHGAVQHRGPFRVRPPPSSALPFLPFRRQGVALRFAVMRLRQPCPVAVHSGTLDQPSSQDRAATSAAAHRRVFRTVRIRRATGAWRRTRRGLGRARRHR